MGQNAGDPRAAPIRVLLIEPHARDVEAIRAAVAAEPQPVIEMTVAERLSGAIDRLGSGQIHAVLTSLTLPDGEGLAIVNALRAHASGMPVIVMLDADNPAYGLAAIQQGVQDVLVKGQYSSRQLVRALQYAIERRRVEKRTASLKDDYVSTVTHELRAPLLVIQESVALIRDQSLGTLNNEQRSFLDTVASHVDRLQELVNGLLDLSKIDAKRLVLARRAIDLGNLVNAACAAFQVIAKGRSIVCAAGPLPPVFADANRVTQVLTNLLINAIKFTPEGGTITVSADLCGDGVRCAVTDTGPGIPKEYQAELFQRFRQFVPLEGGPPKGTGLGLAICKELVELHGGAITMSSEPGRGTTFAFTLPVYHEAAALAALFQDTVADSRTKDGTCGLLVIDGAAACDEAAAARGMARAEVLEEFESAIRKALRGDRVMLLAGGVLAVFAVTHAQGVQAIARRLQIHGEQWLAQTAGKPVGARIRCACALYPQDGTAFDALLACASARLRECS